MKRALGILKLTLLLLGSFAQAEVNSGLGVMGFQAWKVSRVEEAKAQLERLQGDSGVDKVSGAERSPGEKNAVLKVDSKTGRPPQDPSRTQKSGRIDQKLQQAQLNLEIVQELSVNDYFVLYLNQFKDRSAFLEAARKLSADEAADLMMAYQKHLSGNGDSDLALPAVASPAADGKNLRSRN